MRIKNAVAAARQNVTVKTLARWDKRFDEIGYPKPIYILGQIFRDFDGPEGILVWEANNPHISTGTRRTVALANLQAKPQKSKQPKPKKKKVKDKAEAQRSEARRDPRQQGLPGIGGPK